MDLSELFVAQVRSLQALYPQAHTQLLNWGAYSRDLTGIIPNPNPPASPVYAIIKREEWDRDGYADEEEAEALRRELPADQLKNEARDREPYDATAGEALCDFLHAQFDYPTRRCLLVAYVKPCVPEARYPMEATCYRTGWRCTHDEFLERLERVLGAL